MDDIEKEVEWRMGRLYHEQLPVRDTIEDHIDLELQKKKLIEQLNERKGNQVLLDKKEDLLKQLNILRDDQQLHTDVAKQISEDIVKVQQQLSPGELTNQISSIQSRLNMRQGHYRVVDIPSEYATKMHLENNGRDSYHREGFLFECMIENDIQTRVCIGGERSFGYNGVCISQARTPGDDQVILYSDHNLFPVAAIDFLTGKHFNQHVESVPFEQKRDVAVWRGNDTGGQGPVPGQKELGLHDKKINRVEFVNRFRTSDLVDCELIDNKLGASTPTHQGDPNWLTPEQQANEFKYLVYLEGNDAGSNPRWIFSTQCVVFAPDIFTSHLTWHYHMRPWVNYVPFNHDLSDLEDKIEWAQNNPKLCHDIIKRANEMHRKVTDVSRERKILSSMFRKYTSNIII